MKQLEKTLKALANGTRLKIVQLLKKGERVSVTEISHKVRASYKATSKHLAILYQIGILNREQVSYEMHYRLAEPLTPAARAIIALL